MLQSKGISTIPFTMAIPVYIPPEEIEVGQAVFHNFVHDEFAHQGLSDAAVIDNSSDIINDHLAMALGDTGSSAHEGYKTTLIKNIGSSIRELANEFDKSPQRQQIKRHADEVDLGHVTFDRFWGLLEEVFKDGINSINIVALFFFCSDVLIKSVKLQMLQIGISLFKWSLRYIAEQVCKWIHEHGGWNRAFRQIVTQKYFKYGTVAVIGFAICWGLYKGFKS